MKKKAEKLEQSYRMGLRNFHRSLWKDSKRGSAGRQILDSGELLNEVSAFPSPTREQAFVVGVLALERSLHLAA